jgi:RNA polymerase sigma-B factor
VTSPTQRARRWGDAQREQERALFVRLSELSTDDGGRSAIRDELVTMNLPLVQHLARRYRDRGEPMDDLVQVGTVGLIKAVDRFDVSRELEFSTFATPTVLGEIKRYFRDKTWATTVPRRLKELSARVSACTEELTRSLHRSPTAREVADRLDVSVEDVLDAIEIRHAHTAASLTTDRDDQNDGPTPLSDLIGIDDAALEAVEYRESIRPLLAALPDRERQIIMLRFFRNRSQTEIAAELGISQMHVSRLLARTLIQLREKLAQS